MRDHRRHKHDARERADDDRGPKRAGHSDERLLGGVFRLGGRRDDGGGAKARLVGEQAAGAAELQRHQKTGADRAAERGLRREGALEDEADRAAENGRVHQQDHDAPAGVGNCHDGNELLAHVRDGLHAAEDDDAHQHDDGDANRPVGDAGNRGRDDAGHGRRLHRRARADGGDDSERGERDAAELRPPGTRAVFAREGAFPHVHGTAEHVARMVAHAVAHRGVDFHILRGHAEHARDPHPEDGARAACQDCRGNTDDRPRADGRGKRRRKRAEVGDIALALRRAAAPRHAKRLGQLALNEARANGEEDMGAEQERDHRRPPHD